MKGRMTGAQLSAAAAGIAVLAAVALAGASRGCAGRGAPYPAPHAVEAAPDSVAAEAPDTCRAPMKRKSVKKRPAEIHRPAERSYLDETVSGD